ncbi:MAG: MucR family transcriptional regulator [Sphingomonas sp.]|uniref:MucR family transcriptional regulator n=1 Tax=Sphingomonas sp. TaxID=28214 RepID=UPI001ACE6E60|nr:MucR family transcriptional regulator [Sphingomonas sp.]MBN8808205.1 MucR family transcriptional regulator [Sphingomonas sp.]
MTDNISELSPVEIAAELTAAWLANPNTRATAEDALAFFASMRGAIEPTAATMGTEDGEPTAHEPAVSVRKSLASRDHIVSLIDGKPYRTLRRHLSTHGLTPEQYRERYNLKSDYPMVAPTYSEQRRDMAKKIGLGRKPGQKRPAREK